MGEWNRSTKVCALESLPQSITSEIQNHLNSYNLGSITNDYIECIETFSEKKKKGLFSGGGDKELKLFVILTPTWLIWVTSADKSGIAVLSAQLKDLDVKDYKDTPPFKLIQDTGVQISGIITGQVGMHGNQSVSSFLGLGEESAASQFKEKLMQAYQNSRKK